MPPIYEVLKRHIGRGKFDAEDIKNKMDLYVLHDRITGEQYDEIMALMAA